MESPKHAYEYVVLKQSDTHGNYTNNQKSEGRIHYSASIGTNVVMTTYSIDFMDIRVN